jgi:hypothetical protein
MKHVRISKEKSIRSLRIGPWESLSRTPNHNSALFAISRKDCPGITLTESFHFHKMIFIKYIGGQ